MARDYESGPQIGGIHGASIPGRGIDAPNFGFTDYAQQLQNIERRRRLAEALMLQGLEPAQNQPAVGGIVVPTSPFATLAQVAKAGVGAYGMSQAEKQGQEASSGYQRDLASALTQGQAALRGTPAISPDVQEVQQSADQGTPTPQTTPAQPPSVDAAVQAYLRNPATMQMGLSLQQAQNANMMRSQQLAQILRMGQSSNPMSPGPGSSIMAGAQGTTPGQPTPGQTANPFEGVDPRTLALLSSGDPELVGLGKNLLEAHKGVAQRANAPVIDQLTGRIIAQPVPIPTPGTQVTVGPQGNVISPIPGAIPAASAFTMAQTGAQEAGRAPYQLQTYNTEGAPTLMTNEQAIRAATGRAMPIPGQPQGFSPQGGQGQPQGVPPSQGLPSYYRGGLRLQDQGAGAFQREQGTKYGELAAEVVKGGDMGRRLNDLTSAMNNARSEIQLAGGDVNRLAGAQQSVMQIAQAFNIDPSKLGLPRNAGPYQLMDSITNRMAMGMIGPGGMPANNFSEADREFLINTVSKKSDTPQGFEMKLDMMQRVAKRNIDAEQSWLQADQQGKSFSQWRREWNGYVRANPLFAGMRTPSIDDLIRQYGPTR